MSMTRELILISLEPIIWFEEQKNISRLDSHDFQVGLI